MADLEKHAFRRDKRYLVRLVLALAVGVLGGAFIWGKMTSPEAGTCAADALRGAGGNQGAEGP